MSAKIKPIDKNQKFRIIGGDEASRGPKDRANVLREKHPKVYPSVLSKPKIQPKSDDNPVNYAGKSWDLRHGINSDYDKKSSQTPSRNQLLGKIAAAIYGKGEDDGTDR